MTDVVEPKTAFVKIIVGDAEKFMMFQAATEALLIQDIRYYCTKYGVTECISVEEKEYTQYQTQFDQKWGKTK